MNTETQTQAAEYAATIAGELRQLDRDVQADPDRFYDWVNNDCLELSVMTGRGDRFYVEILRTYGGPYCHVAMTDRDGDTVIVFAAWGSDRETVYVTVPHVAEAVRTLADAY